MLNKQKILIGLFTVVMLMAFAGIVQAAPVVVLDGQQLLFDVPPVIENNRTLVPLRAIFEAMGADVDWDQETMTAMGHKGDITVLLPIGSITPTINGVPYTLDVPGKIVDGRTLAPLRFIGEAFGGTVGWDGTTQTITISSGTGNTPEIELSTTEIARQSQSAVMVLCKNDVNEMQGSGIIVDSSGLIATNYHVIDGCTSGIVILADGTEYNIAGVVAYDVNLDLAVLKIMADGLPAVTLGDSLNLELGEEVVAISSPLGLSNTISTGIISGLRDFDGVSLIQTSAQITHGSSGGGLFNRKAELIGITAAGMEEADLNFAVPIHELIPLIHNDDAFYSVTYTSLADLCADNQGDYFNNPPYIEVEELLNETEAVLYFGEYIIEPSLISVQEFFDGELVGAGIFLDYDNAEVLFNVGGEGMEVETYLEDLALFLNDLYPSQYVSAEFILSDFYDDYPDFVPEEWVDWDDDMQQWYVFKSLVESTDYYNGCMETTWDPY